MHFHDEATNVLQRYPNNDIAFVGIWGSANSDKSFFYDRILNLSDIDGDIVKYIGNLVYKYIPQPKLKRIIIFLRQAFHQRQDTNILVGWERIPKCQQFDKKLEKSIRHNGGTLPSDHTYLGFNFKPKPNPIRRHNIERILTSQ